MGLLFFFWALVLWGLYKCLLKAKWKWLVLKFFEKCFICYAKRDLKKACLLKVKAWFFANQLCGYLCVDDYLIVVAIKASMSSFYLVLLLKSCHGLLALYLGG